MKEFDFKSILGKEFQIFMGRIGSGKTEIAINLAIILKKQDIKSTLFDIDIVKPYVRIRDIREKLSEYGLDIVSPPELTKALDLPVFPKNIIGEFMERGNVKILDVGGDPYGAGTIAQFREYFAGNVNLFFVINTRRPFTSNKAEILNAIYDIESASKMNLSYLVFNTNLRWDTTREVIEEGFKIVKSVSYETKIPIAFAAVDENRSDLFDIFEVPVLKLKLFITPLPRVEAWVRRR